MVGPRHERLFQAGRVLRRLDARDLYDPLTGLDHGFLHLSQVETDVEWVKQRLVCARPSIEKNKRQLEKQLLLAPM